MSLAPSAPSLRRLLLPLALVIGLFAISPVGAQAYLTEHPYGGGHVMKPGEEYYPNCCVTNPVTTTGNIAVYSGAGSVSVCQKTYDLNAGVYRTGCAINQVGNALNLMPYYGHYLVPGIKNNSPWNHTIHGYAYDGTP